MKRLVLIFVLLFSLFAIQAQEIVVTIPIFVKSGSTRKTVWKFIDLRSQIYLFENIVVK